VMTCRGGCHSSGISLGDALRLPKRHPAWRRREAQPGSCMERENLDGDAKAEEIVHSLVAREPLTGAGAPPWPVVLVVLFGPVVAVLVAP
jgi:hypothetical protein